jgi:hypothetical protein
MEGWEDPIALNYRLLNDACTFGLYSRQLLTDASTVYQYLVETVPQDDGSGQLVLPCARLLLAAGQTVTTAYDQDTVGAANRRRGPWASFFTLASLWDLYATFPHANLLVVLYTWDLLPPDTHGDVTIARNTLAHARTRMTASPGFFQLRDIFLNRPDIPNVTKVIGFDLGEFTNTSFNDTYNRTRAKRHMLLHFIQEFLEARQGNRPTVLSQDQGLLDCEIQALQADGVPATKHPVYGFLEVDQSTLVVSIHPNIPVREIVFDISWPAAIICREVEAYVTRIKQQQLPAPPPPPSKSSTFICTSIYYTEAEKAIANPRFSYRVEDGQNEQENEGPDRPDSLNAKVRGFLQTYYTAVRLGQFGRRDGPLTPRFPLMLYIRTEPVPC